MILHPVQNANSQPVNSCERFVAVVVLHNTHNIIGKFISKFKSFFEKFRSKLSFTDITNEQKL